MRFSAIYILHCKYLILYFKMHDPFWFLYIIFLYVFDNNVLQIDRMNDFG